MSTLALFTSRRVSPIQITGQPWGWIVSAMVAVVAFLGSPGAEGGQIVDDFNDGNDTGWTRYDPIGMATSIPQDTWSFPAGGYRLQARPSPSATLGPGRVGALRPDLIAPTFQIAVDLADWDDALTQAMGLIARTQTPGPATTSGYIFGYVSGPGKYAQIVRVTNERTFSIANAPPQPITLDPAKAYRMVFQGLADKLEGRIYELPNLTEPIVTLTASEGTYADGPTGLIAFSLNSVTPEGVDVTFDNFFSVDAVPPRMEMRDLGFGLVQILWPGHARDFTLEYTDQLPASAWTPVSEALISYFADIDRYIYQTDALIGHRFFRLRRP
jgi:hypothetical protein